MSKIRVYVRIRPSLPKEFDAPGVFCCVQMEDVSGNWIQIVKDGEPKRYFARCWGPASQQEDVYRVVGVPTVNDVFEGYFGTVFVYGQTGTGKTYTLGCSVPGLEGVQPRAIQHIYDKRTKEAHKFTVTVEMQYVQLYRDSVQDLLNPAKDNLVVRVEETGAVIEQVTSRVTNSYEESMALVKEGDSNRVVANTKMNSGSSRSHACLIIELKRKSVETQQETFGRLYLIDLAGSERVSKSGVTGDEYKEAVAINKSLTVLGNCIAAIVAGEKIVAFRDSKLTRLLQHSLSGHGRTSIIVTIRPDSPNMQETLCTLKFGERAQKVEAQMTPASYRDQMFDLMAKGGEIEADIADKIATAEGQKMLAITLRDDCAQKDTELQVAEADAREKIAQASAQLDNIKAQLELQFKKDSDEIASKFAGEMDQLKKANASIIKEIEEKVAAAVSKVNKDFASLKKERNDKIESAKNKRQALEEKVGRLKPIEAESIEDIVARKSAEIAQKAQEIRRRIRSCKPSPNEGLTMEQLQEKYDLSQDILLRVEDRHTELIDALSDWNMKKIEKKAQDPTEEEIEVYLKDPPPKPPSEHSDSAPPSDEDSDSGSGSSSDSEGGKEEEKKEEEPEVIIIERKQFDGTCKKEKHLQELVEQILHYLEYGSMITRLNMGELTKEFMFIGKDRTLLCICDFDKAGQPNRKNAQEVYRMNEVREFLLGQTGVGFQQLLNGKKSVTREHAMPPDSQTLTKDNINEYHYRSITILTKKKNIDFVCDTDTDFEAWMVALHRMTHLDPRWADEMDIAAYPEAKHFSDEEKDLCKKNHITPTNYLNARDKALLAEQRLYLTLYDVRTVSNLDLLHSQKLFEHFCKMNWLERHVVHHLKYRDQYLEAQRQKEDMARRKAEEAAIRNAANLRKDRLRGMFKKYKIKSEDGKLPDLLTAYAGSEDIIIAQLVKKYGPEPSPEELTELLKPPNSAKSKHRKLFTNVAKLSYRSHPAPPIPKCTECTPEMLQALENKHPVGPQIDMDPIVVEGNGKLGYYDMDNNKEYILVALREIFSHCCSKALDSVEGIVVQMSVDAVITFLSQDPKEVGIAEKAKNSIQEFLREVATASSAVVVDLASKSPTFIGTLVMNCNAGAPPVICPLLPRCIYYYDKMLGTFEDLIISQYDSVLEVLMSLRKRVTDKRPGINIPPPPTPAHLIDTIIMPWFEENYSKAQEEFLKNPPKEILSQQALDLFDGKYFSVGKALGPNDIPPQAVRPDPEPDEGPVPADNPMHLPT